MISYLKFEGCHRRGPGTDNQMWKNINTVRPRRPAAPFGYMQIFCGSIKRMQPIEILYLLGASHGYEPYIFSPFSGRYFRFVFGATLGVDRTGQHRDVPKIRSTFENLCCRWKVFMSKISVCEIRDVNIFRCQTASMPIFFYSMPWDHGFNIFARSNYHHFIDPLWTNRSN